MPRRYLVAVLSSAVLLMVFSIVAMKQSNLPVSRNGIDVSLSKSEDHKGEKMDSPELFAEFHYGIRTREGEAGPSYPMNYQIVELLKARGVTSTQALSKASSAQKLNWIERGPGNVAGRTRSIIVDPADPTNNTWLVGSVGGGIWKTPDAGKTWQEMTAGLTNLATSTLAMGGVESEVIYAGTGEGFRNVDQISGNGVWKSTDRGRSWQQLASTINNDFRNITRVIVDPKNENVVLVSTAAGFNGEGRNGIFRSTDGGQTWALVYSSNRSVEQILANPKNFNTQFATVNGVGVLKSTDGGKTWSLASAGLNGARFEMAIAPSDTNRLFVSAEGTVATLYVSDDAGATWAAAKVDPPDATAVDFLGGQGWYDNTIAVDPFDKETVYAGGVSIFKFVVKPGASQNERVLLGIDYVNTSSFFTLVNITGSINGVVASGSGYVPASEQVSVELRFGPGRTQKAHRFTVPAGATSGVADANYTYRDYIDVPFQVWDVDNNRQLMVAFRDQLADGQFNMEIQTSERSREYIMPQLVPYSTTPSPDIAKNGGQAFKRLYLIWPVLPDGGVWNPTNLPNAVFRVRWGNINTKTVTRTIFQDSYQQFGGSNKGVHPDHHQLLLIPTDAAQKKFRLINANDGGISYSDDGGATFSQTGYSFSTTFPATLRGYNTSQFYGVDKMNGADRYIGGTQDNGTFVSPANPDAKSEWVRAPSGDGFEAVWHYRDPQKLLQSAQFNSIRRSLNGGSSWSTVSPPDNTSANAPFFTKIAKSKQDPELVFAIGLSGIWRSDNFATSWTLTRMPSGFVGNSSFSQVKISLASPDVVWAGRSLSTTTPLFVSTDGGVTFNRTQTYTQNLGSLTGIATHPTDEKTAYALFSFARSPKILRTRNLGQTWEDISGFGTNPTSSNGFPDVATFSLLVMPYDTNIMWAGTEIGIFESTDGGKNWKYADNGLPPVAVWEMLIVNDEVVVATHGRGVWSVSLPQLAGYEPPAAVLAPRLLSLAGGLGGVVAANVSLRSAYDSSLVVVDGAKVLRLPANPAAKDTSVQVIVPVAAPKTANVSLLSYRAGKSYSSGVGTLPLLPLQQATVKYSNNFNNPTQAAEDFAIDGLNFDSPDIFTSGVLNSPHPYLVNKDHTAILLKPITVASANATLQYDDIAIVQPAQDYVVIEGTADFGQTWKALRPRYDASADSRWLSAYNNNQPGQESMFKKQEINLLNTFAAGEKIVIRFRLFSNAQTVSWGWAIDNLLIQDKVTAVEAETPVPLTFNLAQNYPNPFNPSTTITYALPKPSEVQLTVYNAFGQKVRTLVDDKQAPGNYQVVWNGTNDAGESVATGVYFYKIIAADYVRTLKMLFVK
ncbi:MAG: T9SS type A sorting domain-containing protein [candidate division KSB1 bacterium]|nr:T9SS type A sorting domain-containing protein [candidate division KSB1 bacterium]MDZ7365756.1 T9SS type A sorting domain-containing protein [candidate division KSB1 bacterium]MDZ7403764.1 T9SS type A sorting domain-containing protein [candidate division KSB1 bacterium]